MAFLETWVSRPLPALRRRQAVPRLSEGRQSLLRVRARFHAAPRRRSAGLSSDCHRRAYRGSYRAGDRNRLLAPVGLQLAIYLPLTVLMSLALLQPVKGAVVGLQWALRMHGFDDNAPEGILPAS